MGPATDVYAIGAILYHLIAARMPYVKPGDKVSNYMILRWVREGPPEPVENLNHAVPAELAAICVKAMARNIQDRYPDMGAMAEDLRAYLEGRVVKAYETGAVAEFKKWVKRNKGIASSIARRWCWRWAALSRWRRCRPAREARLKKRMWSCLRRMPTISGWPTYGALRN
jgi:hypothetical protein